MLLSVFDTAQAFCPNNGYKCGFSGVGKTHQDITTDAITAIDSEIFRTDRLTTSMKIALKEISQANSDVDGNQENGFLHFDGESLEFGKNVLQHRLTAVIKALDDSNTIVARNQLGRALHSIQDFYSHTNFIESGGRGANRAIWSNDAGLGALATPNEATCQPCDEVAVPGNSPTLECSTNITTNKLTSGYYGGEVEKPLSNNKCRHGGPSDHGPGPLGGINKDVIISTFSPHNFWHAAAADSARQASEQFIRDIAGRITPAQLKLLLGAGPTVAVAMDTTGSMGNVIAQMQGEVARIIDGRIGTDQEPLRYILSPFNDPSVGPLTITDDPEQFKRALNALEADGGGDCPELAMTAQLHALSSSDQGIALFTFSDADAKDSNKAGLVSSLARKKSAKISPILVGACYYAALNTGQNANAVATKLQPSTFALQIDPGYRRIAADSGGQLFLLNGYEVGQISSLVDAAARANAVDILSVADQANGVPHAYSLPLDSTVERVTFSLSGVNDLTLQRPDGSLLTSGDPGVSEVTLSTGRIVTLIRPMPGVWQASVAGTGAYSFSVLGESEIALDRFDFVEVAGRPGHEGYFVIEGLPIAHQPTIVTSALSGDLASVSFELRSKDGTLITPLDLHNESQGNPNEFFGELTLPTAPFLVYAKGTLANGETFQRVIPAKVLPQTVRVFAPAVQTLHPGQISRYTFTVRNYGNTESFRFNAEDDHGFIQQISPARFDLASNQSIEVNVELAVPTTVEQALNDTLTVTVESERDPEVSNYAVMNTEVEVATVDCSQTSATPTTLWPPNHQMVPISITGVTSSDGGAVALNIDAITQNEPTIDRGNGSGNTCPDATGVDSSSATVRAERSGGNGGRTYSILFSASNAVGSRCTGKVDVCVPHERNGHCESPTVALDATTCH